MSVETFNPAAAQGVRMSPAAVAHAQRQLAKRGAVAVRLAVKQSGCSGFMYALDYVEAPEPQDTAYALDGGLTVYVDPEALPLVQGTEIDLVTEGLNHILKFQNPNATAECGCGESFAVS